MIDAIVTLADDFRKHLLCTSDIAAAAPTFRRTSSTRR